MQIIGHAVGQQVVLEETGKKGDGIKKLQQLSKRNEPYEKKMEDNR